MCIISALVGSLFAIALTDRRPAIQAQTVAESATSQDASQTALRAFTARSSAAGQRNFTPEESIAIAVYDRVNRSVVNIHTVSRPAYGFGVGYNEGSGSGWVYDRDGHIVTNNHVIADGEMIEVTFHDGHSAEAKVVGSDPANDIAVLKVDAAPETLFPVEIGESSNLRVGQRVYAIGNPFGLERTMTEGIVSSLNRTLPAEEHGARTIKSIIQIDAALNRGNSGGPLLDTQGLLIGMNTAIATSTGENTGVGFAIAANNIQRIVPMLIRDGRVIRASLGIAAAFSRDDTVGIYALIENGPAERAGLKAAVWQQSFRVPGGVQKMQRVHYGRADLILAVNGQAVHTPEELLNEVEKHAVGEVVTLTIVRQSQRLNVDVRLGEE
jgi:S1-C subfamily serine protease